MAAKIRLIENDTELDRALNRLCVTPARPAYVEVGEDNVCLPSFYRNYEEKIRQFLVRDDDIYLIGHPKTGTTWSQEMIWLIVNNLDYVKASETVVYKRFPQLEFASLFDTMHFELENQDYFSNPFEFLVKSESPRCIKTHLHWPLLPESIRNGTKNPKMIVILRNAEDTCVSLYHHSKVIDGYKGTFEEFCELFIGGRVCFGPFWNQVLGYWHQKAHPRMLFIKYKDMKEDLPAVIRNVAEFLEKSLTEKEVEKLAGHLSFESMKKNSSVNHEQVIEAIKKSGMATEDGNSFIRKGQVGGFVSEMSPEMIRRFDDWTEANLKGTGLCLK